MARTTDAELVVVGGGPIGLATALRARAAGIDVVVVEPRDSPIDKACGEGLMPGALRALTRLGAPVDGVDFHGIAYVSGARRAEHRFRGGHGTGVRRTMLQSGLADRADEVGIRRVNGRVDHLVQDARSVTVSGAGLEPLSARWLVACDGLHSTVRDLVGLSAAPGPMRRRRFGLRRHFSIAPWSELVEVHWTGSVEAYVTPVGPRSVGVAVLGPPGLDFATALASVGSLAERLAGAPADGPVRGAGPLRQRTTARTAGRVLLAGDASGYVDALTGEGLRVGFAQADAAVRGISAGDARGYEREWIRETRDFRLITSALVAAARSPLRPLIVPASVRSPALFGAVVERLAR
jgi:flavin-dependent dehydrogenase